MKKKIHGKFILISAAAIAVTGVCSLILFYNILKDQIFDDIKADARVISVLSMDVMDERLRESLSKEGLRITLIEADGAVVYDSREEVSKLENHGGRKEIMEALSKGEGQSMRKSETSTKHTFYYAMKLGENRILRISKGSDSIYRLMFRMGVLVVVLGFMVFWICLILSRRLTKSLVGPIEKMADNIVQIEEESVYEEMRPFIATIKAQHIDILQHAKIRQEFTANVSHELKTPLTAISGYAELIANGMTSGTDTVHFASEIHRSAERLQHPIPII